MEPFITYSKSNSQYHILTTDGVLKKVTNPVFVEKQFGPLSQQYDVSDNTEMRLYNDTLELQNNDGVDRLTEPKEGINEEQTEQTDEDDERNLILEELSPRRSERLKIKNDQNNRRNEREVGPKDLERMKEVPENQFEEVDNEWTQNETIVENMDTPAQDSNDVITDRAIDDKHSIAEEDMHHDELVHPNATDPKWEPEGWFQYEPSQFIGKHSTEHEEVDENPKRRMRISDILMSAA